VYFIIQVGKENSMDKAIKVIKGVGEVGIDTNASPGNGPYYVKHYATGYDVCGFDSVEEALMELEFVEDGALA
jgi:hypothetical protein